jgi:lipopolysaccharide transport system permease protein
MSSAPGLPPHVVVYTPQSLLRSPGTMFREMLGDLRRSRELAWRLAVRDISAQYRTSVLGYLWAFIAPLATTLMWVFMNAAGVVKVSDTGMPYAVFVFSGTMLWQMFTESLNMPQAQVTASQGMVVKLNFPREALILAGMLKVLFSVGVKMAVLVPVVLLFGVLPDAHLLLFPVAALALVLVGTTIGLLLVPVGTLYSDVGRFLPMFTQFLMYVSPVVYAMPKNGLMATVFQANPLSALVLTGRAWLTGSASPMLPQFLLVVAVSAVLLLLGWVLYRLSMSVLIERMGS